MEKEKMNNTITFYGYIKKNEQFFIKIDYENKTYITNKYHKKSCNYGFSCFELKGYREIYELERYLKYKGFKELDYEEHWGD